MKFLGEIGRNIWRKCSHNNKGISPSTKKEAAAMPQLTAKELTALGDQLGMECSLVKKYEMYAQVCADPQLRTKCEETAAKHRNHYQALLGLLG